MQVGIQEFSCPQLEIAEVIEGLDLHQRRLDRPGANCHPALFTGLHPHAGAVHVTDAVEGLIGRLEQQHEGRVGRLRCVFLDFALRDGSLCEFGPLTRRPPHLLGL